MDAKLNQSDLISLLAKESNISVARAELFTKNFFDLIVEGLEQDGIVKINGLGTFKVTDVASRGSVNVNTGEKIEIKGHRKLVFTPADVLKDTVNQPFAMFEPVEVDDTYQPDSTNVPEVDDLAEPVEPASIADEVVETSTVGSAEITESKEESEESAGVETTQPDADEEPVAEAEPEPVVVQERPAEPVVVRVPKKAQPEQKPAPAKKKNKWLYTFSVFLGVMIGSLIVRSLGRNHTGDDEGNTMVTNSVAAIDRVANDSPVVNEIATVSVAPTETTDSATQAAKVGLPVNAGLQAVEEVADEIYVFELVDELASLNLKDITVADTLLYVADGEICQHTVAPDETLTKIAKHYFFDKKLWPYIVKYNNMDKPDELCSGMKIAIPLLKPRK